MITDEDAHDVRAALARCAVDIPPDVVERLRARHYRARGTGGRLVASLTAVVMVVGITVAVLHDGTAVAPRPGPGARPAPGEPSWRLVSDVNPSSWQEPTTSGFQSGLALTCPTDTTCYAEDLPGAAPNDEQVEVTHDGGATWQQAALPGAVFLPVAGLDCVDADTCVTLAAGSGGKDLLVTTEDGGRTWTSVPGPGPVPSSFVFSGISCTTTTSCVAVGADFATAVPTSLALVTTDDGTSWSQSALPAGFVPSSIRCAAAVGCLATGDIWSATGAGAAVFSPDGGSTWASAAVPAGVGTLDSISCSDPTHCFATAAGGSGPAPSDLLDTTDGGRTWNTVPTAGLGTSLVMDVTCTSATSCWVSGALVPKPIAWGQGFALAMSQVHGLLAVTDDQGQSWQTVAPSPSLDIGAVPAVSCPDPTTCFALGYQHTGSGPGGFVFLSEGG